jgi:hypothetical protein
VVSIPPSISSKALGMTSPERSAIVVIPKNEILNLQPEKFGRIDGVGGFNYMLGTATLNGSKKVSVIAIANNDNSGRYVLVPPNSNPEDTLRLLRSSNSKVA